MIHHPLKMAGYLVLLCLIAGLPVPAALGLDTDSKFFAKFGYNFAFNDSARPCVWFQGPPGTGAWLPTGGACTGGWAEAYSQTYLRRPLQTGARWLRLDFDLNLNGINGKHAKDEPLKLANRQIFVELGQVFDDETLIWIGKRSYRWEGLWVIGMPLASQDGVGLGFYNARVFDVMNLGLAVFRTVPWQIGPAQHTLDLRLEDIALFSGRLKSILALTSTSKNDARTGKADYEPLEGRRLAMIYDIWMQESETRLALAWGQGLYGASDSQSYASGSWIDESGAWRAADTLDAAINFELRRFLRRSQTWRLGAQYRFYPQGSRWSVNAGIGLQHLDFGGLRYRRDTSIYNRPDMTAFAMSVQPVYRWQTRWEIEAQLGHIEVQHGLAKYHRLPDGRIQNSIDPVDRKLTHIRLAVNYLPLGRWQVKLSPYIGYSLWNKKTSLDVQSDANRRGGHYAGLQSSVEF